MPPLGTSECRSENDESDKYGDVFSGQARARPKGRRELMPPVREHTREAALQAARRVLPPVTAAMVDAHRRYGPGMTAAKLLPQPEQIAPTELDLVIVYIPGATNAHPVRWWRVGQGLADG